MSRERTIRIGKWTIPAELKNVPTERFRKLSGMLGSEIVVDIATGKRYLIDFEKLKWVPLGASRSAK